MKKIQNIFFLYWNNDNSHRKKSFKELGIKSLYKMFFYIWIYKFFHSSFFWMENRYGDQRDQFWYVSFFFCGGHFPKHMYVYCLQNHILKFLIKKYDEERKFFQIKKVWIKEICSKYSNAQKKGPDISFLMTVVFYNLGV